MTDLFNREVKLGDIVGFNPPKYKGLERGIVIKVSEKSCKVEWNIRGDIKDQCSRNQVMVLPREEYPEFYL